tara:strand:+ start:4748 stop:4906 length:159 start_codon:yes stop_codon:yes gene_type:complete
MTKRSKEYIKRQRDDGIIAVRAMIPVEKKQELARIAKVWRDEHKIKQEEKND